MRATILFVLIISCAASAQTGNNAPKDEAPANPAPVNAAIENTALDQARVALGERRYDRCLELLASAPDVAERHRLEGEARFFKGDLEEAVRSLERYLARAGAATEGPRARFRLAECLARLGRFAEAVDLTRQGLAHVASPARRAELARLLMARGRKAADPAEADQKPDLNRALSFFREAAPFAEGDAALAGELAFDTGKTLYRMKKNHDAARLLAPLVGVDLPADFGGGNRKQREMQGHLPAVDVDRPAASPRLDDKKKKAEAARMVADTLLGGGRPGLAREVYRRVFAEDPEGEQAPASLLGIARAYGLPQPAYRHALEHGAEALERMIQSFPKDAAAPEALDLLARAHRAFNRPKAALRYLADLVKDYPKSKQAAPAAREIARIHRAEKEYEAALAAYDRALAAFPTHRLWAEIRRERIDCEYERATHARARGDLGRAAKLSTEFLAREPLDARVPQVLLALGQMAEKADRKSEAARYYTMLASKYPQAAATRTALLARAKLEEGAGDFKAARATLKAVPGNGGRGRLATMDRKHLVLSTRNADGVPTLELSTRNLEQVEMRLYRISAADYFRKHLTLEDVAKLDVPLIRPNHTWTVKVKDYQEFRTCKFPVEAPNEGWGAYVVSAVAGDLRATTLLLVSRVRIIARMAGNRIDVVVGRGADYAPLAGARVLIAGNGRILLDGKTDAKGNYRGDFLDHERPVGQVTVLASAAAETAWTRLAVPARSQSRKGTGALLWTDRRRYQPGDTVRFWVVAGQDRKAAHHVEIVGREQIRIRRFQLQPDAGGFTAGAFRIPLRTADGSWRLRVTSASKEVAAQNIEIARTAASDFRVTVRADSRRVKLGASVRFVIRAMGRFGHPVAYERLSYRVSGAPSQRPFQTDAAGRAEIVLPSDRYGLTDSIAVDVYRAGRWIAGDVVPVVWDGFRATVEPKRDTFLLGEPIRAVVSARSFEDVREKRDLTVVVRRVHEGGRSEEVCRVPVRTAAKGQDVTVTLPIPGEGAFSLLLEGDKGMVPTGSALFVSGPDDPKKIRILGVREAVRPGTELKLRVHCRADKVAALLVAANHRDQRIQRVALTRGSNLVPVKIRAKDLPWVRIRVGASMGKEFHADEITVAVDDPLAVKLAASPSIGRPGSKVTLRLEVKDGAGKPAAASAVLVMVPERLAPLYRGFFQGVGEAFMGDTKAADSPLASSYPFTYRSGSERVAILGERRAGGPGIRSNWASVVDRNAVIYNLANNPMETRASAYVASVNRNFDQGLAQQRGQVVQTQSFANDMPRSGQTIGRFRQNSLRGVGRTANVINPMFLNQGSGQVYLARNEVGNILAASNDSAYSGLFQDIDATRNGFNRANVMLCSKGTIAIVSQDLESRLRALAEASLRFRDDNAAPRFFHLTAGPDGRAEVTTTHPDGKWRVIALVSSHAGGRFQDASCELRGEAPVRARVIAPRFPQAGDTTAVDVLLESRDARPATVRFTPEGGEAVTREVKLAARTQTRVRFPLTVASDAKVLAGRVEIGEQSIPFRTEVVADHLAPPPVVKLAAAAKDAPGAAPRLTHLAQMLGGDDSYLARAAWVIARTAELESSGRDAAGNAELGARFASLLLGSRRDGGWSYRYGESLADPETSVIIAWALGAAEKAGLEVPGAIKKRLVGYLKQQFSSARDDADKTPLLLGLSRLSSVDFAYANRLFRARASLSCRDLAVVLVLLRRQGDDSPMVKTLAELLAGKAAKDGSFAGTGSIDPLGDVRSTTALAAMALFGLKPDVARRAVAHLDGRPICAAREAAGLAFEAALRVETGGEGAGRKLAIQPASAGAATAARVRREIHYLPLQVRGYTLRRNFNVQGHYRDRGDETGLVGEGQRCRVELRVAVARGTRHAVVLEAVPSGMRLVPGSVSADVSVTEEAGVIRFHVRSDEQRRKGDRWLYLSYQLESALPGAYAFRRPVVVVPGGPAISVGKVTKANGVTVAPVGEDARKGYQLSPNETEGLGRIYWSVGEYDRAYKHLRTLRETWRLRSDMLERVAAMLLDMDVRWKSDRGMVDHFEILKEVSPERSVAFRKILPVAEAYAKLGEHERALQVQRGCLDGFFHVDTGIGHALLKAGDLDGFRAFMEPLIALYPAADTTRDSRYFLGQTLLAHARKQSADQKARRVELLAGAAHAFRTALVAGGGGPGTEPAAFALAGARLEQEQYDRAAALAARAVKLFPDSYLRDGFEYVEAFSRFETARYEAAEKICRRLSTADYRNKSGRMGPSANKFLALHMLAKIHHARGEVSAAVEAYRKVKSKFPDAARALEYFEWRVLRVAELTELAGNEDRRVGLTYKNVDRIELRAYRVDLMTLYLRERSLNRIANINLAGIKPFFEGAYAVRPSSYRMDEVQLHVCRRAGERGGPGDPIPVVLPEAGAYLLVIRAGGVECMGMVLRTDLRMDVQTVVANGTLRATVYDRTSGAFASRVEVKFVGSRDKAFTTARTDLRGVAEAVGLRGHPTVIAKHGDQYAFYRSSQALGQTQPKRSQMRSNRQSNKRAGKQLDGRLQNVYDQLDEMFEDNMKKVKEQQSGRGGVQMKSVK